VNRFSIAYGHLRGSAVKKYLQPPTDADDGRTTGPAKAGRDIKWFFTLFNLVPWAVGCYLLKPKSQLFTIVRHVGQAATQTKLELAQFLNYHCLGVE
jgi:hypothetical protein